MPTSTLHVIANIRAKPEHADDVLQVLLGYIELTRAEQGCLVYDLFQDVADPTHFTFVEEWSDVAALEAHSRSAHLTAGRQKLAGWTVRPNEVVRYSRLA
ncbi:MAG: putative quinol monooxygenase [Acidobacteriota bacterium]